MTLLLSELASGLRSGQFTSRDLIEQCLERAQDSAGEGARTFTLLDASGARREADRIDAARRAGQTVGPWAGIPVSVKDLFDVAGQVTTAGSAVLREAPPAGRDAEAVARLKAQGLIVVGRTNMTEFAYSGLGLNPHYGTPASAFDRPARRIPGGSSSGAAISVTDRMAAAALGSDTGGSCRIPAALNGIVGYKPTAGSVPMRGTFPLSPSLDSVGPLASSVRCCEVMYSILSGSEIAMPTALTGLRLAIPQTVVLDGLDADVARTFEATLSRLSQGGVTVSQLSLRSFGELAGANSKGGLVAAEAYTAHRQQLALRAKDYDQRVRVRMEKGALQSPADYAQLQDFRSQWIAAVTNEMQGVDFLVCPTVPTIAPLIADLDDDEAFGRINLLMLRNPTFANFLDGCSISLPCHTQGQPPVGLMLIGRHGDDRRLLSAAHAIETLLAHR